MPHFAVGQEPGAAEAEGESDQTAVDPREVLKQGSEMLEKGEFVEALKVFDDLVNGLNQSTDPGAFQFLPPAIVGRGRALAGLGEDEAAMEDFKRVIDETPEYADARVGRGQLYLKLNRNEEALIDFESAITAQRTNLQAQFGFAKASVLLGGMDQAVKPLSRVIAADPQNGEAFQLRGRALNGLFKTPEAIADLEQALSLNSDDYEAYFWLGVVRLRTKDYQDAVNQFTQAIEHYKPKPGQEGLPYYEGYYALASAYVELGKSAKDEAAKKSAYQSSIDVCEKLLAQIDTENPNFYGAHAAALFSRGVGERMLGDFGTAIKTFSKAIELNPDFGDAYFRRGICLHLIGEDKMAISDFQMAANLNPFDDPRSNIWEGFTHAKLGDYYEALRAYGNAIAASDRYTPAYVNRGLAYMALG
jgi:tetratricopeptide (TPR) repeat protein